MAIRTFADQGTEDVFDGKASRRARSACPTELIRRARQKLDQLNAATSLDDLKVPPGNKPEPLHGDRKGQHSIRINEKYRVCFRWRDAAADDVEIVDYH